MTNMIPFQQQQLPAFLQQAAGAANVNALAASGTGGGSVDHISLKGGRFHVVRSGQQPVTLELFNLDVIIVHANPGMTKAFYAGQWNPDESEAPICSSDDGVRPRADATQPQCASCAACPQNQFGSRINPQTGKEAKACQDKKTIAIVTPGQERGEMLRLQVPAASLKDFGTYLRSLPNVPYFGVITRISFDTSVSFPKIKLQAVDYVRDPQAFAIIQQRHDSDEAKAIAGVAGFTTMRALEAPQQPALSAPPAFMQPQAQIPVQNIPVQQPAQPFMQAQVPVQQPVYQQPVQAPQVVQQPQAHHAQTQLQQPQVQQPQYQQPVQQSAAQPLSTAPTPVDPSVAAIFGGQAIGGVAAQPQVQAQQPMQQAQAANVHPSGREYGRPMPGKARRTKAEMAEDAAVGIGQAAGEQSEEEAVPAQGIAQQAVAPAPAANVQGFGQQPAQQPQQPVYQQPANQPQVMQPGATADAFAGWDD